MRNEGVTHFYGSFSKSKTNIHSFHHTLWHLQIDWCIWQKSAKCNLLYNTNITLTGFCIYMFVFFFFIFIIYFFVYRHSYIHMYVLNLNKWYEQVFLNKKRKIERNKKSCNWSTRAFITTLLWQVVLVLFSIYSSKSMCTCCKCSLLPKKKKQQLLPQQLMRLLLNVVIVIDCIGGAIGSFF